MMKILQSIAHLQHVNPKVLEHLVANGDIIQRSYHKGATVHDQNTPCQTLDIVISGKLLAYSLSERGSETVVFEFLPGDSIGANLLFGNSHHYPMNIYCARDSSLIHVAKSAVSELLHDNNFVMEFITSLSSNSQGLNKKIAMYTQKTLRENILDYMLALSIEKQSNTVELPISKKQLADFLGVQRPSLFRELKRMKEEGMIRIENRKIHLDFL